MRVDSKTPLCPNCHTEVYEYPWDLLPKGSKKLWYCPNLWSCCETFEEHQLLFMDYVEEVPVMLSDHCWTYIRADGLGRDV